MRLIFMCELFSHAPFRFTFVYNSYFFSLSIIYSINSNRRKILIFIDYYAMADDGILI